MVETLQTGNCFVTSSSASSSASPPRVKKMRNVPESSLTDSSDERSDYRLAKDYSKYVIVAESEFEAPGDTGKSAEIAFHNALWKIFRQDLKGPISPSYSTFSYDDSPRSSSQSPSRPASRPPRSPYKPKLDTRVRCNHIFSANTDFHAEILFIDGKEKTQIPQTSWIFSSWLTYTTNLMRKCEEHLKFCYEIPIDDRIFLAAEYDLNGLKVHTALEISDLRWKEMWKEHKEKLLNPEFICLFDIIMGRWK
ncbi:hypothetical protein DdX_15110 [Ditylenchus destructor]|uniref:Uncharacterized protein n=1 Tax=Ditylenchus destructor TaxID=166010 RepID=A0AAD4MQX9_9BILA|nr:hypothetical protein DdX_15110 [Ditylenchus destructor]